MQRAGGTDVAQDHAAGAGPVTRVGRIERIERVGRVRDEVIPLGEEDVRANELGMPRVAGVRMRDDRAFALRPVGRRNIPGIEYVAKLQRPIVIVAAGQVRGRAAGCAAPRRRAIRSDGRQNERGLGVHDIAPCAQPVGELPGPGRRGTRRSGRRQHEHAARPLAIALDPPGEMLRFEDLANGCDRLPCVGDRLAGPDADALELQMAQPLGLALHCGFSFGHRCYRSTDRNFRLLSARPVNDVKRM